MIMLEQIFKNTYKHWEVIVETFFSCDNFEKAELPPMIYYMPLIKTNLSSIEGGNY